MAARRVWASTTRFWVSCWAMARSASTLAISDAHQFVACCTSASALAWASAMAAPMRTLAPWIRPMEFK